MTGESLDRPENASDGGSYFDIRDDEGRPFTVAERRILRALIQEDKRAKWFWSSARIWITYGAAVIAALWAAKEQIQGAVRGVFHP